jgi:tetratricopeptide (TPR) repeat protein
MELLELYFSPLDDLTKFKVIVTQSPMGEGETSSSLPFLDAERDWRITVIRSLEVSSFDSKFFSAEGEQEWMERAGLLGSDRSSFHPNYLVNIGQILYNSLFPPGSTVEQILQNSINFAECKNTKLVVQLKFEADVVQKMRLADYPWELLHNQQHFLSHYQVEFSRYIAYKAVPPNLLTADKLNVLLVSSAASDEELGLKPLPREEQKAVGKGLETAINSGHISLYKLEEATFAKLEHYLTEHRGEQAPHVLHFDGHGLFGKCCRKCGTINSGPVMQRCRNCNAELPSSQGYLVFENKDGDADYISAEQLGTLLHQSGLSDGYNQTGGVVLVVLSACQSGMAILGESVFNGAAQNLIAHRVPAVVAMQYSVRVDSATKFAEKFYRSLGQKNSLAVAVSQGRAAMGVGGNQWYRPVLYLRWQDNEGGQLFSSPTEPQRNYTMDSWAKSKGVEVIPHSGIIRFVGRSKELEMLHKYLQGERCNTSIVGMAGVGKTELAIQYAQKYWQEFYPGGVCWLSPKEHNIGIKIIEFVHLNMGLLVPETMRKLLKLEQQVTWCWQNWKHPKLPILVVIDDVTDYKAIQPYLPPPNGHFKVLITTRKKWLIQSFHELDLDIFDESDAMELLRTFLGIERIEQEFLIAKELCNWLGYLPLGLELVARYLQRKKNLTLKCLLKQKLEKERLKHKSLQKTNPDMTAQLGIEEAFKLNWQELDTEAKQLGCLLSLFAPSPIPWSLVELCFPDKKTEILEEIRDGSLISLNLLQDLSQNAYQLHSLIRDFLKRQLEESDWVNSLKQKFCQIISSKAQQIPQSPTQHLISELTMSVPHIVEVATILKDWLSDDFFCFPFVGLGRFYAGQGIYNEAEKWYKKYEEQSQTRFGGEHLEVASSLNNLANFYRNMGRYHQAMTLFQKALNLSKRILGDNHLDVATILNNFALLYCEQGRPHQAEPLFKKALEIRENILEKDHPDLANILNNQAYLYSSLDDYNKAEIKLKLALKIREKCLGKNHPDVATTLNNLAYIYENQERYGEAERKCQEALELRKSLLGEENPNVAQSLHNLGVINAKQKNYNNAKLLLKEALKIFDKYLGTGHRYTISTRKTLEKISNNDDNDIDLF